MDRVFIIAEAGINHQGDLSRAKDMVVAAKEAGADAVKFQTYWDLHDIPNITDEMLAQCELTRDEWRALHDYCAVVGIEFMSTADTVAAVNLLHALGMSIWKMSHKGVTDTVLVGAVACALRAASDRMAIVSIDPACDGITLCRIIRGFNLLANTGSPVAALQCVPDYPAHPSKIRYDLIMEGVFIGLSDHTEGIGASIKAVQCGAFAIEKHFTLDKTLPGPDHWWSLNPDELAKMIVAIRQKEEA